MRPLVTATAGAHARLSTGPHGPWKSVLAPEAQDGRVHLEEGAGRARG